MALVESGTDDLMNTKRKVHMAKGKTDRISVGLVAVNFLIFTAILLITIMNFEFQDSLVEFRYNFIKNFVGKYASYWQLFPVIFSLLILVSNIVIMRMKPLKNSHALYVTRLYMSGTIVSHIFLLVIIFSNRLVIL